MSFWDLSTGEDIAGGGSKEYEIEGGDLTPIPSGSSVLALIDEARWDNKEGNEYINLRWSVLAPDEYKNRKVFQKLWVKDDDPNARSPEAAARKRDKAKRMLAAIDANAGGKLAAARAEPTNDTMTMHLTNKPMIIRCQVWSMDDRDNPGQKIEGNWISMVAPKSKGVDVKEAKAPSVQRPIAAGNVDNPDLDDEFDSIPFS